MSNKSINDEVACMSGYISRGKLIKDVENLKDCYNGFSDTYDKACIIGLIAEQPSVERKRGKWMPSSYTWSYYNYDCSVCGCNEFRQVDHNGGYKAFNFCPNCGADMREANDEKT